jgi:restriction system protein
MAVPDFQTMMLPFLEIMGDEKEHSFSEMSNVLARLYNLSDSEVSELVPSGRQTRLMNRIYWISTHFKKALLIEPTRRGAFRITSRGSELLGKKLANIDLKTLQTFPEYVEFKNKRNGTPAAKEVSSDPQLVESKTPDELLFEAYQTIRETLANEILEKVKSCSPTFFERLVVELLVKMGYGGTLEDAGQAIGKSGDGGIDGIIKEDRLGLDVIYLQAKRWEGTVSRPELQKFAGALLGKQARKGVFITTSNFTNEAQLYVKSIASNIILIDGDELADLMIDYNVGVSIAANYEIKKIDSDYFIEE